MPLRRAKRSCQAAQVFTRHPFAKRFKSRRGREEPENEADLTAEATTGEAKAHTKLDKDGNPLPESEWEPLFTDDVEECPALEGDHTAECEACRDLDPDHGHLNKVAYHAARSAAAMFEDGSEASRAAFQWGYLAGLWHDLGKFDERFQARLRGELPRANHSTAGAQHAMRSLEAIGQPLAYIVASHHAGLADLMGGESSLHKRLTGEDFVATLTHDSRRALAEAQLALPLHARNAKAYATFTRLLFSCLVDADFLATEAFMNPVQAKRRACWPDDILARMERALAERYAKFGAPATDIDQHRATVHADCLAATTRAPGLFTLTVPTGGGKTLASLAFALRHAHLHGLRRVVYVAPYTSIIEQNAAEYRDTFAALSDELGHDIVLEHHSNFESPEVDKDAPRQDEKPLWRLAAENWDAPLVVTTSVQFFESLYANKTSRCRKLHRIARSVVVLDEAQTLPPDLLAPCLDSLKQLTRHFGTTVVLCTATQPALGRLPENTPGDFATKFNNIALDLPPDGSREIVRNVPSLFSGLRRTTIENLGTLSDEQLADTLRAHDRALCILNTKPHAARIFELLDADNPTNIHLSAQLCPAHRTAVLAEIRHREETGKPCRVIATTVVEAGVDIDFPVAYRALTGLDSLAQAAGRCNRHGKLGTGGGKVFLFTPAGQRTPQFLTHNVAATTNVLPDFKDNPDDLILTDAIEAFFHQFYLAHGHWDKPAILTRFEPANDSPAYPFRFDFKTAARDFRLIPDHQLPVVIEPKPDTWTGQDEAKSADIRALIERVRQADKFGHFPPADAHRKLQRYTVQIPTVIHRAMVSQGKVQLLCDDRFPVLTHAENDYDSKLGLLVPDHITKPDAFIL